MHVVAIVQARMGSSRLPGKAIKLILGKPMLAHVIERLRWSKLLQGIIIATTIKESDNPIVELSQKLGVNIFRGSEDDVLDRYYKAFQEYPADAIVRITSDCPLIDPEVVDKVIGYYLTHSNDFDCVANNLPPTYPAGIDVEAFSFKALTVAWQEAIDPLDREHALRYICSRPERFRIANIKCEKDYSHIRLTVDQKEDLILVRRIFKKLWTEKEVFRLKDIIKFLEQNPELLKLNNRFQSWRHTPVLRDPNEMYKLKKITQIHS